MLSEVNAATEHGSNLVLIFAGLALVWGAMKCWSISRRPATNTKCVLSLMIVLLLFVFAGCSQALLKNGGSSFGLLLGLGIVALVTLAGLITAMVLAILGLVECSKQRFLYTQGRAQASWTLALVGVMWVFIGAAFIKGVQRAYSLGPVAAQGRPGNVQVFDDLNFRFRSPDHPWVSFDATRLNKASQLSFMRRDPEALFFIIAEKMGPQANFTTEQLAEVGKANLQAKAASCRVVSEVPWPVKGLNGLLVETDAQVGAYQFHYRHWYLVTNGYAYQLIGNSPSADQQREAGELNDMLSRFELIDPNRVASFAGGVKTNFYSPQHHYAVMMTNSAWHRFSGLDKTFPMAEFGLSQGDSCLVVVPARLSGEKISTEALVSAFLATMEIPYPNENLVNGKRLTEGDLEGQQFDYAREVDGSAFRYRLKVLQRNGEGYFIAAWTQRRAEDTEPVLADAMARVRFLSPTNSFALSSIRETEEPRESKTRGYILNQAGLYYDKQGEYEQALALFRAAAEANDQESLYAINALGTWQHLDRPKDGLAFIDTLSASLLKLPEVRASRALFQAQASLTEQAVTNYADLFATGYRSDLHFTEYIDLLAEQKQYDLALAAIQNYLKSGDSIAAQVLEAQMYRFKKDWPKTISLLGNLHENARFNSQVAEALAETYIQAGQPTEALGIAREMIKDNGDSADYEYLKGQSELGLKWYRESKLSFTAAARLAPANKNIRSYLDYVSGLLGEGESSAVMDAIEPVPLPAALTNLPADTVPADYAKNYGAYYVHRLVACNYALDKQSKTTEFTLARMLDASGVSAFSTVQVAFDPLAERVFVNEVRVMDAGGKTISTGNPANYYVLDDHAGTSATQRKVLNIPIPGLQPGCQLSVTITREQQGHLDEFPFCAHSFATTVPVHTSIFFLAGDASKLKYQTSPSLEPEQLPEGLCWRVSNPLVAQLEPLQPPAADFLPMLWISDASASWPAIVSNYLAAINDRLEPDPALQSQSQQLVSKLDNAGAKIALLASYVQTNLTYKAIEFGRRAHIPNRPADVARNKYGDCKDHAVLLQQMLAAAGVPAQLALVNYRGPIKKDQPSLDQFDHMIVYVPGDGDGRFVDCTSKGADLANPVPAGLGGQETLILDARNPRFITIPQYPENASSLSVEQNVRLVDETDLTVEESLTLAGVAAAYMRDYLLQTPEASRRTFLQNAMGMSDVELTDLRIDSLSDPGEPLRLKFAYSIKKQFRHSDNQVRGVLRAGFARSYLTAAPVDNRSTPFEIKIPLTVDIREHVAVPAGFKAAPPENLELKLDPRFATGHGEAQAGSDKVSLNFQCRVKTGKFLASDYAAYRQTMAQVLSSIEREVVFNVSGH